MLPQNLIPAVVLGEVSKTMFHLKTITDDTCFLGSPRGKLKRKKYNSFLNQKDYVLINPLEGYPNQAIIHEKLKKQDFRFQKVKQELYDLETHICTLKKKDDYWAI